MAQTAPTGRAAQLLAIFAVLFGLLAMHGVASAHHAAATPAAVPTAPATELAHSHDHSVTAALAEPATDQAAAALTGPTAPACQDDCGVVTALCVAVLTGAALALLLGRRRACPLLPAPTRRTDRAPAPFVRLAPGPDPVRELCISRT